MKEIEYKKKRTGTIFPFLYQQAAPRPNVYVVKLVALSNNDHALPLLTAAGTLEKSSVALVRTPATAHTVSGAVRPMT